MVEAPSIGRHPGLEHRGTQALPQPMDAAFWVSGLIPSDETIAGHRMLTRPTFRLESRGLYMKPRRGPSVCETPAAARARLCHRPSAPSLLHFHHGKGQLIQHGIRFVCRSSDDSENRGATVKADVQRHLTTPSKNRFGYSSLAEERRPREYLSDQVHAGAPIDRSLIPEHHDGHTIPPCPIRFRKASISRIIVPVA